MTRVRFILVLLLGALAWALWPPRAPELPALLPSVSTLDATSRIEALRTRDTVALSPGCGTIAWLSGRSTPHAYVLFHGLTNCPMQFAALAESLHARGDNVLVPRVPHHGYRDRMTTDLAQLNEDELASLVIECVGIARGLGDTVVVAGLSTGGVAAAWAAAHLPGVGRAVLIAPALAPPWKPRWLAPAFTRLALHLPNAFVWWDDRRRESLPGPPQCYPRFSTRAMASAYALGEDAMQAMPRHPESLAELDLVTTDADRAIDNGRARDLAERARTGDTRLRVYAFPAAAEIHHDMIDPRQVGARTDVVYPVVLALLRGEVVPARAPGAEPDKPDR